MSQHLYWKPDRSEGTIIGGFQLRDILRDISTLDHTHVPYVRGLSDAGVPGASELLDVLSTYGTISIWIAE